MEALRTILSVPGVRPSMIEKAKDLPADAIMLDLEDSVPPVEKMRAREIVREALPSLLETRKTVMVRINGLDSGLMLDDLRAVAPLMPHGISLPKIESAADMERADALMAQAEREAGLVVGSLRALVWIETAKGVVNAYEICCASPRILAALTGADDFTMDMGIDRTKSGEELFYMRSAIVVAARAANVMAIDVAFPDFQDDASLIAEARLGRQLGYNGKYVIHPRQIEPVNRIFTPSPEEVAEATEVVAAFAEAVAQGLGAISVKGRMIDIAAAERARKVVALARAIAQKEGA